MSETPLSKSIAKALETLGYPVIRLHAGSVKVIAWDSAPGDGRSYTMQLAPAGTPDRLVMLRGGKVLWLEVKTRTGVLNADQVKWHARAARLGHVVRTVRSVTEAVEVVRAEDGARRAS